MNIQFDLVSFFIQFELLIGSMANMAHYVALFTSKLLWMWYGQRENNLICELSQQVWVEWISGYGTYKELSLDHYAVTYHFVCEPGKIWVDFSLHH